MHEKEYICYVAARIGKSSTDYAIEDHDYTIGKTSNIFRAKKFESPHDIMAWMGGHYKSYTPVKIRYKKQIEELEKGTYPPEEDVFDD